MNKYLKYTLAVSIGASSLFSCSSDETIVESSGSGKSVQMTVVASREDNGLTRTELSENAGNLDCVWTLNDQLLVTDVNGNRKGVLTATSISEDKTKATFTGELHGLQNGAVTFNYYYFGNKVNAEEVGSDGSYIADFSRQDGSFGSLSDKDLLTTQKEITIGGGSSYVADLTLVRRVSFAHFKLAFADDVALAENAEIVISGDGLNNMATVSLTSPDAVYAHGNVVVSPASSDIYMVLLPNEIEEGFRLNFSVESDGKTYKGTFPVAKAIAKGKYYRKDNKDGTYSALTVNMSGEDGSDDSMDDGDVVGPVFEVNGKKFRFTRANLQYNTKTSTYSIPEKQTEYICASGRRVGASTVTGNPEIIGLFRWGATGIDDNVWQPQPADFWKVNSWDSSNSTVSDNLPSQNSSVNRTLTTNSTLCPNGEAQDTPFDWGVAYTAQQGTGHYFTLTSTELKYVINNWFAACCTVDGVEGAIILPFTTLNEAKEAITAVGGKYNALYKLNDYYTNRTQFGYDRMTLDYEQLTKLNGVFFPASGMGNPNTGSVSKPAATDYQGNCYYWTSSPSTTPNAIIWYVNGGKTQSSREYHVYGMGKCFGASVRLVKEVTE